MDGAHGNSAYHRAMAQRPDPLHKELAFFRRLLASQERELSQISKRSDQRDHSRETLEVRTETRKTRRVIENLLLEMGKREGETQDGEGGAPPDRRATRPLGPPPHTPPPPPPDISGAMRSGTPTAPPHGEGKWEGKFPRSARQIKEDEREEAKRAAQTHTWTSTTHGLREDSRSRTPHKGLCRVSPIQCGLCRTYRIPVLHFCYRCFPRTAVNHIVEAAPEGGRVEYRCIVCFVRKATRTEIHKRPWHQRMLSSTRTPGPGA